MDLDPTYLGTMSLSWDDIHRDSRALAVMLKAKGSFAGIIAIARGGLVPAAILARELDIRQVDTVCIASYGDGTRQEQLEVLKRIQGDGGGWLVVDDLVDTGTTARVVRAMLPGGHYATLYAKPSGKPMVDTYVTDVAQATWLVFPWDAPERI